MKIALINGQRLLRYESSSIFLDDPLDVVRGVLRGVTISAVLWLALAAASYNVML